MGDSLVCLTYHEYGMGSPDELAEFGISYRVMEWYGLAMGGAVANGRDVGNINTVGVDNLTNPALPMIADIDISSEVSATNPRVADITVKVTAKQQLPNDTKLHIIVYQTRIHYEDDFGVVAPNGLVYMLDVVRDLVTDTFGVAIPALGAGQSHSVTGTFTAFPSIKDLDSLRTAAIVQVDDTTKQVLSVAKTNKSPLDTGSIPIITGNLIPEKAKLQIAYNSPQKLRVILPFDNARALVYNTAGRILRKQRLYGVEGDKVTVFLPQAEGLLFIRLISEDGKSLVCKIPFK